MPKILHDKANAWATEFYRTLENFVYGVITKQQFADYLTNTTMSWSTQKELLDMLTNPPDIDYTSEETD